MIDTSAFKTKTEIRQRKMYEAGKAWPIGIDIGYSGTKVMSQNTVVCFPSFARRTEGSEEAMGSARSSDIYYRGEDGAVWLVGDLAYSDMGQFDVSESERELYGRNRYYSPMFLVVARVGLALGRTPNGFGDPKGKKVAVQTGLPPKYLNADTAYMKDVLSGRHSFEVKVGKGEWEAYSFEIDGDDISVMSQPKGTLLSAAVGNDGKFVPGAGKLLRSNVIIPDTGFGTFDVFSLRSGKSDAQETFPNLGMREVFRRTCRDMEAEFGVDITIPYMQKCLGKGTVMVVDPRNRTRRERDFSAMLEKNCLDVCRESAEKIMSLNEYCVDTDCIIPAGGAYDAWKDEFNRFFKDYEGIRIIPGNVNAAPLSNVYSNVRGYFYNLAARPK